MVPYRISFSEGQNTLLSRMRSPTAAKGLQVTKATHCISAFHRPHIFSISIFLWAGVMMGGLSKLLQVWSPSTPKKIQWLLSRCSGCHIFSPSILVAAGHFFPCWVAPSSDLLFHIAFPKQFSCYTVCTSSLWSSKGIQIPASLQGAFWSLLQQLAYMSLGGKACIHVVAHLKH